MKPLLLPSGLQRGIPFLIQEDWSPEQALAVIKLLDDLREVIWCYVRQFLRGIVPHSVSEKVLKRGQGRTAFLQFGEAYP